MLTDSCCGAAKNLKINSTGTAAFSCEYSWDQRYDGKILFKTENDIIDEVISTTNTRDQKERLSIYDDRQNIFSVRITAVTPDDGGVYLCGVWDYKHPYSYSIINTVHLHIISK